MFKGLMILFFLVFWSLPMHASISDDDGLQRLDAINILFLADPDKAQTQAIDLWKELDKTRNPRTWLRTLTVIGDRIFGDKLLDEIRQAMDLAEKLKLPDEQALLLVFENTLTQDQAPRAVVERRYARAVALAEQHADPVVLGWIWAAQAAFYFYIADFQKGMTAIQTALHHQKNLRVEQLGYYYDSRSILASLWAEQGQHDRSIPLDRENLKWFIQNKVYFQAARMAYNLVITLLASKTPDYPEIERLLTVSENFAKAIQHKERMGDVLYARGRTFLQRKSYGRAAETFAQAGRLYETVPNREFSLLCKLYESRSLLGLGKLQRAQELLEEARKSIKAENAFEQEMELETRIEVLESLGQYRETLKALDDYFLLQQNLRKKKDAEEMKRLNTSLGLQVEEARSKTLKDENELQALRLEAAKKFQVLVVLVSLLSLGASFLAGKAIQQNNRIKQRRSTIQRILDNLDEGLLLIDQEQRIGAEYSKQLLSILGTDGPIAGYDFMSTVLGKSLLSNDQKAVIQQALAASLGEDLLVWSFNEGNLPAEIAFADSRILSLRWIPVPDRHNTVNRVLISVFDLTQERQLETEIQTQKTRLEALASAPVSLCSVLAEFLHTLQPKRVELIDRFLAWTPAMKERIGTFLRQSLRRSQKLVVEAKPSGETVELIVSLDTEQISCQNLSQIV